MSEPSWHDRCGRIRHLDPVRARLLVEGFRRPITFDERSIETPAGDAISAEASRCVTLAAVAGEWSPEVIGHEKTHLHAHGLCRLPMSVARELVRHPGHIYLDGLTAITHGVAEVLGSHDGGGLSLDGLRSISAGIAAALGRHRGELSLNGVRHLDAAVARGLAPHEHDLSLAGVESLDAPAAAALSRHRGDLHLPGVADVAGPVGRHLACHLGQLHLHGMELLRNDAAEAFGERVGHLCLKGLRRLSERQAESLAGHRGELQVPALEVDDAVAECLGRHEGALLVNGSATLPLHRLQALVRHRGPLEIGGLRTLDESRAGVLAAQTGPRGIRGLSCLFIDDVASITPGVAAILATHAAGGLALNGVHELSEDAARELVKHPLLGLDRLARVSDGLAAILSTHAGVTLSLRGLREASPRAVALLRATPSVELGRHLGDCGRPSDRSAGRRESFVARDVSDLIERLGRRR